MASADAITAEDIRPTDGPRDAGPPGTAEVTVRLEQGTNMALALSPDGQTLVLALQGVLWRVDAAGGEATALTDLEADAQHPSISPDGRSVAFQSFVDGFYQIRVVDLADGATRTLTDGAADHREPHWSPDGAAIAFASDRGGTWDVWRVPSAGGPATRLTRAEGDAFAPAWSPDGSRFAYVVDGDGLYVSEPAGVRRLWASTADLGPPAWSPDGRHLALVEINGTTTRLMRIAVADGAAQPIAAPEDDIFPFRPAWADAGTLLYTADGHVRRLRDGASAIVPFSAPLTLRRSTPAPRAFDFDGLAPRPTRGLRSPAISPDGERIALTALGDLWLQDVAGGPPRQLTDDPYVDLDPAWSPDGDRLVFVSDRSGRPQLWILELATGAVRRLTDADADLGQPAWSPDGARIAALSWDVRRHRWGNADLVVVDASTGAVERLRGPHFSPGAPSWSPDGRRLAFAVYSRVARRYREGVSRFGLVDAASGDFVGSWRPDGLHGVDLRGRAGPIWAGQAMFYVQHGRLWRQPVGAAGSPAAQPTEIAPAPAMALSASRQGRVAWLADGQLWVADPDGRPRAVPFDLTWRPPAPPAAYVLRAGRLWDGVGDSWREQVDIVIEDGRIREITPYAQRDLPLVDASRYAVLPGLIESHAHQSELAGETLGRAWLAFGVTTVREVGGEAYDAIQRREAWAAGTRPGPRTLVAGPLLDGPRTYYGLAEAVSDPGHLESILGRVEALDLDLVKTYVRLPDPTQRVIVRRAHACGRPVSSHELLPAAALGADGVEHLGATSRRGYSLKQSALRASYGDVLAVLAGAGMTLTPTLGVHSGALSLLSNDPAAFEHPAYRATTPPAHRAAFEARYRRAPSAARDALVQRQQRFLRALVDAGGRITAGTDVPFLPYGFSLHLELQLYAAAGIAPAEVLRSATTHAAEALGVGAHLGRVAPGKLADLVVVDGDPLARMADAWNVVWTIKGGHRFAAADLMRAP